MTTHLKEALVSLLRLCLLSTTFYYNETVPADLWNSNGVTVLVVVMEHIEDLALSMSLAPTVFWKRYVDDVLTAVPADHAG